MNPDCYLQPFEGICCFCGAGIHSSKAGCNGNPHCPHWDIDVKPNYCKVCGTELDDLDNILGDYCSPDCADVA